jgi:hypothetical protein
MPQTATLEIRVPRAARPFMLRDLLAALRPHPGLRLVFAYDGRDTSPGYHVTELKYGAFSGLDCGANPESWREMFVQLWDIAPEPGYAPMTAGKFLAIMRKFMGDVAVDPEARLTFEVSDGVRAMQLFAATGIDAGGDAVRVALTQVPSSCKPRDRWLEQEKSPAAACCGGPVCC